MPFEDIQQFLGLFGLSIPQWAVTSISSNDFLETAVWAAVATSIIFILRGLWRTGKLTFHRYFMSTLRINSDYIHYIEVSNYLKKHVLVSSMVKDFKANNVGFHSFREGEPLTSPGYGTHLGWYKGTFVWVTRSLETDQVMGNEFKENMKVTVIGRGIWFEELLASLMQELDNNKRWILTWESNHWVKSTPLPRRSQKSVHAGDAFEQAYTKLNRFLENESFYLEREIPYHTGILFSGCPGNGKTSLVLALANAFDRDLAILNLSSFFFEKDLEKAFRELSYHDKNSILLIEDIDTAMNRINMTSREESSQNDSEKGKENKAPISMGTLLNILDGITTPHGQITLATTNHPELLDPALTRKGRFDLHIKMPLMSWEDLCAMSVRFFGTPMAHVPNYTPLLPVDVQEIMLSSDSIEQARSMVIAKYEKTK